MPDENILVRVLHHPIEAGRVTVVEIPYRPQTLAQLKERLVPGQDVLAGFKDRQVDQDAWQYTRVLPGSEIIFAPAVADPITALWGMTLWKTIVYVAVTVGLSYLGGLLFGPDMPSRKERPEGQSFSWKPRTTMQEGIAIPLCWGTNMHYGNIVARWTDVDEATGDESLYLIIDYGTGPIKGCGENIDGANLSLGGTPEFNQITSTHIDNWYSTPADVNDNDLSTKVGFYGKHKDDVVGKYESIITFANAPVVNNVSYYRDCYVHTPGKLLTGYEKVYLYYDGAYQLIYTKNYGKGHQQGIVTIVTGGPWYNVTKVKVEVFFSSYGGMFSAYPVTLSHYLYELRVWRQASFSDNLFFNDQPAQNYANVSVQGRLGTLNQSCMEGFEENKLERRFNQKLISNETGPVLWTTPNDFFDDIEYTLEWSRGLYKQKDDGDIAQHCVGVKVEISERLMDSWTTLIDTNVYGNQLMPLYKAYRVNEQVLGTVEHGKQYTLRYSKTSPDYAPGRFGDELLLRSVREVVSVAFKRPGRVLLGITALATADLSGHIDVKWIADDKLVQVYNGSTWEVEWTCNRAYIYLDELTQPVISGDGDANPWVIEKYEGLDPSQVDLAFIYEWAQWCDALVTSGVGAGTEMRMPCDAIVDFQTDIWSLAYDIAQVGRMYPYWYYNTLTGWVDAAVTEADYIDLITMDNTMARSWKSRYAGYGDMAGGVEVFFRDKDQGYERKPRPVSNANAGLYTKVVAIEGLGVTGQALATRVGNHALKRNELIKNQNSVRMYKDALRYRLGKVVRVQNNVPDWGRAFRVINSEADNTVELDRKVEITGNIIWVRSYDEANKKVVMKSYTVVSYTGKVVTIAETWDVTPAPNNLVAIGMAGAIVTRRIVKMRHTVDNYFDVELETYNAALFTSDDTDPSLTNPDYQWSQPVAPLVRPTTEQRVIELIDAMRAIPPVSDIPWMGNIDWTGNSVDKVYWDARDDAQPLLFRNMGVSLEITANPSPAGTTDEFIYFDPNNPTVFSTTNTRAVATAAGCWVVCTNEDGVPHPCVPISLLHAAILQAKTITAEYGQIGDLAVDTLQIAGEAVTSAKIAIGAVLTEKLGDAAVEEIKIAADAVTAAKIAVSGLDGESGNVAANHIASGMIQSNAVVSSKIQADSVTAAKILVASLGAIAATLGTVVAGVITGTTITGGTIRTATSGRRIKIDETGIKFMSAVAGSGKIGTTANGGDNIVIGDTASGGDNEIIGSGYLVRLYNIDNGVPFYIQSEQTVADFHHFNRSNTPTGPAEVGDTCVVLGKHRTCTVSGTPGTWVVTGDQTA